MIFVIIALLPIAIPLLYWVNKSVNRYPINFFPAFSWFTSGASLNRPLIVCFSPCLDLALCESGSFPFSTIHCYLSRCWAVVCFIQQTWQSMVSKLGAIREGETGSEQKWNTSLGLIWFSIVTCESQNNCKSIALLSSPRFTSYICDALALPSTFATSTVWGLCSW